MVDKIRVLVYGDELTLGQGKLLEQLHKEFHVDVVMVDKGSDKLQSMDYDLCMLDEMSGVDSVLMGNCVKDVLCHHFKLEEFPEVKELHKKRKRKKGKKGKVTSGSLWEQQQANKQFKRGKC